MTTKRSRHALATSDPCHADAPRRAVKDFLDLADHSSLDSLIAALIELRSNLPEECGTQVAMVGDDDFGRRLTITYYRDLIADESAREARYNAAVATIPTRPVQLCPVHYADHSELMWGGGRQDAPPPPTAAGHASVDRR